MPGWGFNKIIGQAAEKSLFSTREGTYSTQLLDGSGSGDSGGNGGKLFRNPGDLAFYLQPQR